MRKGLEVMGVAGGKRRAERVEEERNCFFVSPLLLVGNRCTVQSILVGLAGFLHNFEIASAAFQAPHSHPNSPSPRLILYIMNSCNLIEITIEPIKLRLLSN